MFHFRWLWRNTDKPFRRRFVISLIIAAVTSCGVIINPMLSQKLIDDVLIAKNLELLPAILASMVLVQLVRQGLRYYMVISFERTSQNTLINLRRHLFGILQHQESSFFDRYRTGDLMTRFSGDLNWCRHFISLIAYQTVDCIFLLAAAITLFFITSWKLTLLLIAVTPLLFIVTKFYSSRIHDKFYDMREALSTLNTTTQENIAGNRVVKAFARENYEKNKFDDNNKAYRDANLEINRYWLKFFPIIELVANAMSIITIFVGAFFIITGDITPGSLLIFTSLTWAIANPIRAIGNLINDYQRFFTSANKVIEIYYSQPLIKDRPDSADKSGMKGNIKFENVSFSFGRNRVLEDISFEILPGQTLAIIGPTGSGKTTILNLIARFYDVESGSIKIDGEDVRMWKLENLRENLGIATQEVFLFSDTVEGNISFGDSYLTVNEVEDYAKIAAAHNFILKLSDGYDTIIGERGVGLSGGQRQRVALARALAVKPSILMLDDTTSAVDLETERYIQEQFQNLPFDCTRIIVGQRISSVKNADLIIVIEDGKITERGTHDELIKNNGYYFETYALQNDIPVNKSDPKQSVPPPACECPSTEGGNQ